MSSHKEKGFSKDLLITSPFWSAKLETLSHPSAIRMLEDLDPRGPLGIGNAEDPFWKGFKHTYGKKDTSIDFLLRIKKQHPEKIALVQIGDFYETWGVDSVFLVEHCGLNRMGKRGPRAGTPLVNVQAVLDGLTQAGFSVVVCEQADDPLRKMRKTRFIAEIITPSSPVYTYGLGMDRQRGDVLFPECPPEFGLVFEKRGITLVEILPDLMTVMTLEGLTDEAAITKLSSYGGRLSRIFCHENVDEKFLEQHHLHHENLVKVSGYLPRQFAKRMEELIKIDLALDTKVTFTKISPNQQRNQLVPRPLYLRTAQQIGVLPERGIPDLTEQMLPKGSPVTCRNLIRNFLLNPPPQSVATKLRDALRVILNVDVSFPEFPVANPARYVKTLQKQEASPEILKDLFLIAKNFTDCYHTAFASAMSDVLLVVAQILSMEVKSDLLQESSRTIVETLLPILPSKEDKAYLPQDERISRFLFEYVEDEFRGRVSPQARTEIVELYQAVEVAAAQYEQAILDHLLTVIQSHQEQIAAQKKKKERPLALSFDIHNKAIWLRGPVRKRKPLFRGFYHPVDRHGREVKDRWTTRPVEQALAEYKNAVEQARLGVSTLLKDVSQTLFPHTLPIVHLATFSNLMKTLILHAKECHPKGWNGAMNAQAPANSRLFLKDFFPYWMSPRESVRNTLHLEGVALLTGHNMAGKSTLLRSSAVVTLLASCGFLFPAKEVAIPEWIDGWFVRTGAADDPAAGLSAFAVEMMDIKTALRDASAQSLLLIDELGKGTESQAGHAIAGSILEHLSQQRIRSVFATHWHELFSNEEVNLDSIQQIQMETQENQPTYRVIVGSDLSSHAFETALQLGVEPNLIERAKEIAACYRLHNRVSLSPSLVQEAVEPYSVAPEKPSIHVDVEEHSLESACEVMSEILSIPASHIKHVAPRYHPSLKDAASSVVYVLRTGLGYYYVGETDNLSLRLAAHRKDRAKKDCECVYAVISQGKSWSRRIETELTKKFRSLGFPLLSTEDAQHRHFGSASTTEG